MNNETHSNLALIPEVGLTEIDGEPRCRDIDIGERLGFDRPRDVRKLISGNLKEIEGFGTCATAAHVVRGNPVTEYWLNEEQVLLVAALSKAPNAAAVRAMLIRVFVAWRRGHLVSATEGMLSDVSGEVRKVIGGIVKSIVHKEIGELISSLLPAAVAADVAAKGCVLRRGRTAGEIWTSLGYPPIKITSWFGNRLTDAGCQIEGRGEFGLRAVRLFDPDKAEHYVRHLGGNSLVQEKISQRRGQHSLHLVGGSN